MKRGAKSRKIWRERAFAKNNLGGVYAILISFKKERA